MGRRTAIIFGLAAGLFPTHAVGQTPPLPLPDPTVRSPLLAPPDAVPRGGQPFPSLPVSPIPDTPFGGVPPLAEGAAPEGTFLADGTRIGLPDGKKQTIRFSPRYGSLGAFDWSAAEPGTQRGVYTGGVIITVTYGVKPATGPTEYVDYEFATDNLVVWVKGVSGPSILGGVSVETPAEKKGIEIELFMTGNVVVKSRDTSKGADGKRNDVVRILRADQIYYDVENNKAIALDADLEVGFNKLKTRDAVHLYGKEIQRLGRSEWRAVKGGAFTSKLPSDPALRFQSRELTYRERPRPRTNFLGIPYWSPFDDDQPSYERTLTGKHTTVTLLGVPVFYTPYSKTDAAEPLGPMLGVSFGNDTIFGAQFYTTWDIYKLLAVRAPAGHNWRLHADILGDRGTGLGTDYDFREPSVFGLGGPVSGSFRHYGLADGGTDTFANRGPRITNPAYRFRTLWRTQQELFSDREPDTLLQTGTSVTLQSQFAWVSDKNFLEQYYSREFNTGPNQETFALLAGSRGPFYASLLGQGGERRDWVTETQWLPKADAAIVGKSILDTFNYNARASAGYAQSFPTTVPSLPALPTERRVDTGRFDLIQELSVPFDLGPVRFNPYGVLDLTAYNHDLTGESVGRVYGGGGVKAAIAFTRAYDDVTSELFNLRGLTHKVNLTGNYYAAKTNVQSSQLPLLDRLNDDQTDQAFRDSRSVYGLRQALPGYLATALDTSPVFDPRRYAVRRLLDNNVELRDDIQVVQLGIDQRLQTKRGFPGLDHTVDWVTLNLSASLFPDPNRDNFGKNSAFLEYNVLWNVGDRTAVQSAGWFDPFDPGTKYFNVGAYLSRPNDTQFYVGYRQTDPLNSKAVTGNVTYPLSTKYAVSFSASYDFGLKEALSNTFTMTRTGTDLTVSLGFTYNAILNNFGVQFSVVPNLAAAAGVRKFGSPQVGGQ